MTLRAIGLRAALAILCFTCSRAAAQNVTGYDSMPNPYLLLLREPAVHEDLSLNPRQRTELQELNDRIDGPLLALRNRPADEADQKITKLVQQTQAGLERVLKDDQRERLGQIVLRVRGIKMVLAPPVAERLKVSAEQRKAIEDAVGEARDEIGGLMDELQSGKSREAVQRQATLARRREQRRVLGELTERQKRLLTEMIGPSFDPCKSEMTFERP